MGLIADVTYGNSSHYNQFKGLQLGVLTCPIVCVIGAAAFFACAIVYDGDKSKTDEIVERNARERRLARGQDPDENRVNADDDNLAALGGGPFLDNKYDTEPLM